MNKRPVWHSILLVALVLLATTSACYQTRLTESPQPSPSPTLPPQASPNPTVPSTVTFPEQVGRVNDFAGVFDAKAKEDLEKTLARFSETDGIEFVVVAIETTGGQPIFDYSLAMANTWNVASKSKDRRGILLVAAIKDRQWRAQVSKALEKDLPDQVCKRFGDAATVFYKRREYSAGLAENVRLVINHLQTARKSTPS